MVLVKCYTETYTSDSLCLKQDSRNTIQDGDCGIDPSQDGV